jgi:hypothetical protein
MQGTKQTWVKLDNVIHAASVASDRFGKCQCAFDIYVENASSDRKLNSSIEAKHSFLVTGTDSWAASVIFIATTLLSKVNLDHSET